MPLYNPSSGGSITVKDIDGTPTVTPATTIEFSNGTVTDQTGGVARVSVSSSGIPDTLFDAKGDLIVASAADTAGREPVGADGTFLEANAASTRGVRWGTPAGGTFPLGLAAPDKIPASPGAHDEEFEGTADTLPANWAWVGTTPTFGLNSTMPSWLTIERALSGTTEYKLRRSSFTMAATSGLWVKMGNGVHNSGSSQFEWMIYDSASTTGYGGGVHNGNVWVARDANAGAPTNRGTVTGDALKGDHAVIGVVRVSDTWVTYVSRDGIHFQCIQTADTRAFTVDRLEFRWSADAGGGAYLSRASVDWIRYRTDNLFPKP